MRTGDWWGNGEPIHISAVRGKEKVKLGAIRNVQFHNITCTGENGILVYGSDESILHDILFDNVSLHLVNSPLNAVAGGNIDLRGCLYPQQQLFAHDIPGLYANQVDHLILRHCGIAWQSSMRQPWFAEAIRVENFTGLTITDLTGAASPALSSGPIIRVENGRAFRCDLSSGVVTKNVKD